MARRWYVVRTESQTEYLAADELSRDQFEVFFPRVKTVIPRAGRTDAPLFPGYLFLRLDPDEAGWPTFRTGHRVRGLVRFGDDVPWLPDEAMHQLAITTNEINRGNGLWRRFRVGDQVRVASGKFETLAEVVEEAKSPHARAQVLLEFMGRQIRAQVPWKDLRPIEDDPQEKHRIPRRTRGRGRWIQGWGSRAAITA